MQGVRDVTGSGIVHDRGPWGTYDVIKTKCGRALSLIPLGWRHRPSGKTTDDPVDCMACVAAESP
jgi:hypothetical protein